MSKTHPLCVLKYLHQIIEPVRAGSARGESLLRVTLSLAAMFLVLGGAAAEEGGRGKPSYNSAELEQQASEWDSFNNRVEQELQPLLDQGFPDKDASDLNLWFVVLFLESTARLKAKVEDLEAKSPNNASMTAGFGPGSERERFALWTECKPLWPVLVVDPKDETFEASVRAAVESRIRGARLYGGLTSSGNGNGELLRIVVARGNDLFSVSVGLQKRLFDPITRLRSHAYGDYRGGGYSSFGSAHQNTFDPYLPTTWTGSSPTTCA